MQAIQKISEVVSGVEDVTWLTSGAAIVVITIVRIIWHYWPKKEEKKDDQVSVSETTLETYIELIGKLGAEINELRTQVEALAILKEENQDLKNQIEALKLENASQAKKIATLTRQVNKLKKELEN